MVQIRLPGLLMFLNQGIMMSMPGGGIGIIGLLMSLTLLITLAGLQLKKSINKSMVDNGTFLGISTFRRVVLLPSLMMFLLGKILSLMLSD